MANFLLTRGDERQKRTTENQSPSRAGFEPNPISLNLASNSSHGHIALVAKTNPIERNKVNLI